jgi:hypothetical protein
MTYGSPLRAVLSLVTSMALEGPVKNSVKHAGETIFQYRSEKILLRNSHRAAWRLVLTP